MSSWRPLESPFQTFFVDYSRVYSPVKPRQSMPNQSRKSVEVYLTNVQKVPNHINSADLISVKSKLPIRPPLRLPAISARLAFRAFPCSCRPRAQHKLRITSPAACTATPLSTPPLTSCRQFANLLHTQYSVQTVTLQLNPTTPGRPKTIKDPDRR